MALLDLHCFYSRVALRRDGIFFRRSDDRIDLRFSELFALVAHEPPFSIQLASAIHGAGRHRPIAGGLDAAGGCTIGIRAMVRSSGFCGGAARLVAALTGMLAGSLQHEPSTLPLPCSADEIAALA